MNVITFQNQFEDQILSSVKTNTIRRPRKDGRPRVKVGEIVSLRVWTGRPYNSKQREFAQAEIDFTFPVRIGKQGTVHRLDQKPSLLSKKYIARTEGFSDWQAMRDWFAKNHGLPVEGILIHWKNLKPSAL